MHGLAFTKIDNVWSKQALLGNLGELNWVNNQSLS